MNATRGRDAHLLRVLAVVLGYGASSLAVESAAPSQGIEAQLNVAEPAPSPSVEAPALQPMAMHVEAPADVDVEPLRAAVSQELGVEVTLCTREDADVLVTLQGAHAAVRYPRPTGDLSRTVVAPEIEQERVVVIALLVGNLVRDQAGELLESWTPLEPPVAAPEPASSVEAPAASPPEPSSELRPNAVPERRPVVRSLTLPMSETFVANFSLLPPIQTVRHAERHGFWMSVGALRSRVGAIHGLGATLGISDTLRSSKGINLAGLATTVDGRTEGMLASVFWAQARRGLDGVLWSTGASSVTGRVTGVQLSGVLALAMEEDLRGDLTKTRFDGVQATAGVGLMRGSLEGAQLAGLVGVAERVRGIQVTGVSAVARWVEGAQISGLYNHSGYVDGAQIGLVNWGRHVDGAQIGLVNVADELDGPEIGLINVHSKSRVQLLAWGSNTAVFNAGMRWFGGKGVYLMATVLHDPARDDAPARTGPGVSLGAHVPVSSAFFEGDANYSAEIPDADDVQTTHAGRMRVIVGWQFVDWLAAFVGVGVKGSVRDEPAADGDAESTITRLFLEPDLSAGLRVF